MPTSSIKPVFILLVIVFLVLISLFFLGRNKANEPTLELPAVQEVEVITQQKIGTSVEGRTIDVFTYGNGSKELLFVGGIHGGYEWNSVLLAYRFIDYLEANPNVIPKDITVFVIPSINPDGLSRIVKKEGPFTIADVQEVSEPAGLGRFNANDVDLNRNFDCKWQKTSMWRGDVVSAGTKPFSEPEAKTLKDFVTTHNPKAVVFWHSQSNAVYASECENGVLPETLDVLEAYSTAADYKAVESFDAYEITGDAEGWLASINIPAITVELSSHDVVEWDKNIAGVKALFSLYSSI